ncbi:MAG: glycosyltransferase family 2 protein [Gammaproteobacteria bacterium]
MESLLLIFAAITFGYLFFTLIEFILGFRKIKNLSDQTVEKRDLMPQVSILLSVLNEEKSIETVINSLLNLDYPNLEIIAINDRSTDNTGAILERLQKKHSRLRVYHIDQLPNGWFGKNHALDFASQHAHGKWLLFTDADVTMKSDTLLKAMSYAMQNKLHHLTIHEDHFRKQFWLKVLLLGKYVSYSMVIKPWLIRDPKSKKSLGRGAFNLIEKDAYLKCGAHRAIALECLDDLKLGQLLKKNGYRQDVVDGQDYVEFKWYGSLQEMIVGLEKNSFSFFNYHYVLTFFTIAVALLVWIWPLIAVFVCSGMLFWLNAVNVGLSVAINAFVAKQFRLKKIYALFYPFAMCILLYTVLNSALRTYKNKGVIWRGTHYPLDMLRTKKASF